MLIIRYGINNFVYAARRPFNPRKLWNLLHDKFILLQHGDNEDDDEDGEDDEGEGEEEDEDADSDSDSDIGDAPDPSVILQNKRNDAAFKSLLRSKGFFWLATRPYQSGEWSQAGAILTISCGGRWFAEEHDPANWPEDEDVKKSIYDDFAGRWGDRRQELVFIGEGIDTARVQAAFDECLLDDDEMQTWEGVMDGEGSREDKEDKMMQIWEDGWEGWTEGEEDEAGHVH